jgi:HAD superfamily hydrolase (TIGR01509 family)
MRVSHINLFRNTFDGKKLLIFDFDGTLANTTPLHAQAFSETLSPLGILVDYQRLAGRKTADAMLICFADAGLPAPDAATLELLVAEKQRRIRELIADSLEPLPGVDEFLHWAKLRFEMALVTSGSRGTVELALKKLGFSDWFRPMLFAEDVTKAKPYPEGFLRVLEMTNIAAEEALVFEDSEAGFVAARAASIDYIDARNMDLSIPKTVFS